MWSSRKQHDVTEQQQQDLRVQIEEVGMLVRQIEILSGQLTRAANQVKATIEGAANEPE